MHRFEVWAPFAKKLGLQVGGDVYAMKGPDDRGWWRLEVESAGPGTSYGFLVDEDTKPYPDPRSPWQPDGVHGLSRVYDHSQFDWTDKHSQAPPLASGIAYELHIGTFTPEGTLDAAIGKLDYLVELGVTYVELMPVAAFEGRHGWGYDGVALCAVHEPYGGPDGLKRFVNAAHEKGLAVLLDVVYNHFGPSDNYTGKFGPYIVASHHTPWGGAINLEDGGAYEVRRFLCDNALMWLRDYHVDGLRLDAVHAFVDRSAIHFLEQLSEEVEALEAALARRLVLIAESDLNDPRVVTPREAGGFGMDAQWSDDFVYDGIYSKDRKRVHGKPPGGLLQHRFLGYIQDHDQVGNRARGDRLSYITGVDRAKIAAALVLTSPFVPMLFQGEEWAASSPFLYFADHTDRELARAVSEGRRGEFAAFGWDPASIPDPESQATFENSKLKWNEVAQSEHEEMLAWYRSLIRLRRITPSLNDGAPGKTRVTFDEQARWLRMDRGNVAVICNLGEQRPFPVQRNAGVLLASQTVSRAAGVAITLPQDSVVILEAPDHGLRADSSEMTN